MGMGICPRRRHIKSRQVGGFEFMARPAGLPRSAQNCAGCGAFLTILLHFVCKIYSLSNLSLLTQLWSVLVLLIPHNKKIANRGFALAKTDGAPSRTRTCNPQIRNLLLYPVEPWAQRTAYSKPKLPKIQVRFLYFLTFLSNLYIICLSQRANSAQFSKRTFYEY